MHQDSLSRVALQKRPDCVEHVLQVDRKVNEPIMDSKVVIVVPAPDVEGSESHLHLIVESVGLGLEDISPGALTHGGMCAHDGYLSKRDAIAK